MPSLPKDLNVTSLFPVALPFESKHNSANILLFDGKLDGNVVVPFQAYFAKKSYDFKQALVSHHDVTETID